MVATVPSDKAETFPHNFRPADLTQLMFPASPQPKQTQTATLFPGGQDADGTCGKFLGMGSISLNGSERRGPCRRDSSVVRRMLLSESWGLNLFLSWRQHGRLPAKSERRLPLKIM